MSHMDRIRQDRIRQDPFGPSPYSSTYVMCWAPAFAPASATVPKPPSACPPPQDLYNVYSKLVYEGKLVRGGRGYVCVVRDRKSVV